MDDMVFHAQLVFLLYTNVRDRFHQVTNLLVESAIITYPQQLALAFQPQHGLQRQAPGGA